MLPSAGYPPLGRLENHDPLSRGFVARQVTPEFRWGDLRPQVRLKRNVGIYTQRVGSCVLNTSFGIQSTKPNIHRYTSQANIEKFYELTTARDPFPGQWYRDGRPGSEDTGTDLNSACKVLRDAGKVKRWEHIFTGVQGVLQVLSSGQPVGTGNQWTYPMFNPDSSGLVHPTGDVAGGHEWEWVGYDLETRRLWGANSWGTTFGVAGYFCMDFDEYDGLVMNHGDAHVVYPVNSWVDRLRALLPW